MPVDVIGGEGPTDWECGKQFCERCGDCLHCYGGEDCYDGGRDNGAHVWWVPEEPVTAPEVAT